MDTPNTTARSWVRRGLLLTLSIAAAIAILRLMRSIDWFTVGEAFGHLTWWQPLVLLVVLVARQIANAAPLANYIEGISLYRATINDLSAAMLTAFAPPPSDMALRVAMFTSWGVKASVALAGTIMNALTFFIVRFGAPIAGFALVFLTDRPLGIRWVDVLSLLISATLVVIALIMAHSARTARLLGESGGRLVRPFKKNVDPQLWAQQCQNFQDELGARFNYAFPRSVSVSFLMVTLDALLLVFSMRFVGISADTLSVADIAVAFLFAFPLTAFPMSGMGIVDVLIAVACVELAGDVIQEPALAAIIIWRIFTVAGPMLLGIVATLLWKSSTGKLLKQR